jgi:hypothetical protein
VCMPIHTIFFPESIEIALIPTARNLEYSAQFDKALIGKSPKVCRNRPRTPVRNISHCDVCCGYRDQDEPNCIGGYLPCANGAQAAFHFENFVSIVTLPEPGQYNPEGSELATEVFDIIPIFLHCADCPSSVVSHYDCFKSLFFFRIFGCQPPVTGQWQARGRLRSLTRSRTSTLTRGCRDRNLSQGGSGWLPASRFRVPAFVCTTRRQA